MKRKHNLIDIQVALHHETEKAVLVSNDGEQNNAIWIPKSQLEIHSENKTTIITLPEQIAIDKGLV